MATTVVASAEQTEGTASTYTFTTASTFGHTPATGNLVVVVLQATSSVTPPAGNTWNLDRQHGSTTWWSRQITGGEAASYTWTFSSTSRGAVAWEVAPPAAGYVWAADTGNGFSGGGSPGTSRAFGASATLHQADGFAASSLFVSAAGGSVTGYGITGGGTWALVAEPTSKRMHYGSLITTATTALSPTASWTGSATASEGGYQTYYASPAPVTKTFTGVQNVNGTVTKTVTGKQNVNGVVQRTFTGKQNVHGPLGSFTLKAEMAPDVDPLTRPDDLDWVDLGTYSDGVQALSTTRGTKLLSAGVETGTASATLDNHLRHLDPSYGDSLLGPKIRARVRYTLVAGDTEHRLHTGFVESYQNQFAMETAQVTMPSQDLFGILAGLQLPASVWDVKARELGATHQWPMNEEVANGLADDTIGVDDGTYLGPVQNGQQVIPYDPRPVKKFGRPGVESITTEAMLVNGFVPPDEFTISLWWKWEVAQYLTGSLPTLFMLEDGSTPETSPAGDPLNPNPIGLSCYVGRSDDLPAGRHQVYFRIQDGSHTGVAIAPVNYIIYDGKPHNLTVTVKGSTREVYTYIDGIGGQVLDGGRAGTVNISTLNFSSIIAACELLAVGWGIDWQSSVGVPSNADVGNVVWFDRVLDGSEVSDLYDAGAVAWDGDLTSEREDRVLDVLGASVSDRDLDIGTQVCGPTVLGQQNFMAYVRKIAGTEAFACFVDADGKVRLRARPSSPSVVKVFTDDPTGDNGVPCQAVVYQKSWDRIVNTIVIGRENGADQTVTDVTSAGHYGPLGGAAGTKLDTLHQTADDARATGQYLIDGHADPVAYIDKIVVTSTDKGVDVEALLGIEVGDYVAVKIRPPGATAETLGIAAFVESVTYDFPKPSVLRTTYSLGDGVPYP